MRPTSPARIPVRADTPARVAPRHLAARQQDGGLWAPGVRLMRSPGFTAKSALIPLAFCVPLATLAVSRFATRADPLGLSRSERVGLGCSGAVLRLLQASHGCATH